MTQNSGLSFMLMSGDLFPISMNFIKGSVVLSESFEEYKKTDEKDRNSVIRTDIPGQSLNIMALFCDANNKIDDSQATLDKYLKADYVPTENDKKILGMIGKNNLSEMMSDAHQMGVDGLATFLTMVSGMEALKDYNNQLAEEEEVCKITKKRIVSGGDDDDEDKDDD